MHRTFRRAWLALAAAGLFGAVAWLVPPNMDEFIHYHALACAAFRHNAENVFREGCSHYDLKLFGAFLPLRSYIYVGSSPSWLYWPVYALWPSFLSARLIDFAALLGCLALIRRITGLRVELATLLVCLFFPLCFQTAVDTGPVSLHLVMMLALPYFAARADTPAKGLAIGALLFLCVWHKPFFLLLGPGMALIYLHLVLARDPAAPALTLRARVAALAPGALLCLVLCALLFTAETRDGLTYLQVSRGKGKTLSLKEQLEHARTWIPYFESFLTFGHRVYALDGQWNGLTAAYWAVATLALGRAWEAGGARFLREALPWLAAGAVSFVLVNSVEASFAGHHIIFVLVYGLVALAIALRHIAASSPRTAAAATGVLAALGVGMLAQLLQLPVLPESAPDRLALNEKLSRDDVARNHAVVVLDWGEYYLLSLYGHPEQMVLYIEPLFQREQAEALRGIFARTGRKPLFVHLDPSKSDLELVKREFPGGHAWDPAVPQTKGAAWHVWEI